MAAQGDALVLVERQDQTATLTLNRPEARNALSARMIIELRAAMAHLGSDESVRAVVLTGADPAFCAGLDLTQLEGNGENLTIGTDAFALPSDPWRPVPKPVIAAVNGPAVTGGLELVLNCDIVVASERARFADTHVRFGLLPGWGMSVLLPQAVGRSAARWMSLTGEFLSAHKAHALGIVTEVTAHEDLLPCALDVAQQIAANSPEAVQSLLDLARLTERDRLGAALEREATTFAARIRRFGE